MTPSRFSILLAPALFLAGCFTDPTNGVGEGILSDFGFVPDSVLSDSFALGLDGPVQYVQEPGIPTPWGFDALWVGATPTHQARLVLWFGPDDDDAWYKVKSKDTLYRDTTSRFKFISLADCPDSTDSLRMSFWTGDTSEARFVLSGFEPTTELFSRRMVAYGGCSDSSRGIKLLPAEARRLRQQQEGTIVVFDQPTNHTDVWAGTNIRMVDTTGSILLVSPLDDYQGRAVNWTPNAGTLTDGSISSTYRAGVRARFHLDTTAFRTALRSLFPATYVGSDTLDNTYAVLGARMRLSTTSASDSTSELRLATRVILDSGEVVTSLSQNLESPILSIPVQASTGGQPNLVFRALALGGTDRRLVRITAKLGKDSAYMLTYPGTSAKSVRRAWLKAGDSCEFGVVGVDRTRFSLKVESGTITAKWMTFATDYSRDLQTNEDDTVRAEAYVGPGRSTQTLEVRTGISRLINYKTHPVEWELYLPQGTANKAYIPAAPIEKLRLTLRPRTNGDIE